MTAVAWSWALLAPLLLGALLTRAVLGRRPPAALLAASSVGLGHGLVSIVFFVASATGSAAPTALVGLELALLGLLGWLALGSRVEAGWPAQEPWSRVARWTCAAAALAVCLAGARLVLMSLAAPEGGWDAWAIWNLRARFFARGGFADAFAPELYWSHPDYPLLLPGTIARAWVLIGHEPPLVPALVAGQLWAAAAGLLFAGLQLLQGRAAAGLGVTALLAAPLLTDHAASQFADVPLATVLLGAFVFVGVSCRLAPEETWRPLVLAGAHAGLAAWTKNEGLLMLLVLGLIAAALGWRRARERPAAPAALLAGALLPMAATAGFKLLLSPTNDLIAGQGAEATWARLLDVARWSAALSGVGRQLASFAGWPLTTPPLLIAACLLARPARERRRLSAGGALVIGGVLAGYVVVYVLTPNDLEWHLRTSAARVVLQLWPATVFAAVAGLTLDGSAWRRRAGVACLLAACAPPLGAHSAAWRALAQGPEPAPQPGWCAEALPHLPAQGRVGLLLPDGESEARRRAWFSIQYALAPRIVVPGELLDVTIVLRGASLEERAHTTLARLEGARLVRPAPGAPR